jgi:hypothetical protein
MLLISASSNADCVTLASSRSEKLLPMLGLDSEPCRWRRAACWRGERVAAMVRMWEGVLVLGLGLRVGWDAEREEVEDEGFGG